ncbi:MULTISPECIES: medium chain dehydrogenase/reductase family protein [Streptomyces]|uniref:Dehydrogenase n=3 Tax=Streptomyces TaxID=1883 RepID=Q82N36_STRAW|nr:MULTISPECIES: medium chain dehydrogenase/reductase family protein [Streptomyces]BAC69177.1 putative dehydrogenase [Streptomyces avermitilis MA-4680 = NBRC 14893]BBJ49131.1 NADPH:quinone reductase [Streptomyces avermitilis]GDY61172.1 NADPH:quinone reductase [Streptomyces avermitilis]GDY78743.1 NADPH:quinone reductase [Streptomyces avermitilis]GDY87567.1 NADPH:quinone reductase [Streptomyces avermitilis]
MEGVIASRELLEVVLPGTVEPEGLQLRYRALPAPEAGQILIAMEATGVSFAEQQMRRGRYYDQPPFPFVPGYDLVGTVRAAGSGVTPGLVGKRVAALTKVGGWASHVVIDAADAVEVPAGVGAAEAETLVVNGITAWQMLHRKARVRAGQTVLVHGANGGVGTVLVQLARAAGVKVIGTASARHHDALRELGVTPVDYRTEDVPGRVRELAPNGVDAVFDHVGGRSVIDSWRLLAPGGTLVSYGSAATRDDTGSKQWPVLKILGRVWLWNTLPNGRRAYFFNVWAGRALSKNRFRARLRADLTEVFAALQRDEVTARIAARLPLARVAEAMRLAESGTVAGKVVLIP